MFTNSIPWNGFSKCQIQMRKGGGSSNYALLRHGRYKHVERPPVNVTHGEQVCRVWFDSETKSAWLVGWLVLLFRSRSTNFQLLIIQYSWSPLMSPVSQTTVPNRHCWNIFSCFIVSIFTVRLYALHGLSYWNSVRPSVCLSAVCLSHSCTVSTWFNLRLWFLHHMVAPSF